MSQASKFAEEFKWRALCDPLDVRQSGPELACGVCKTGREHKKPLAKSEFRSKFVPGQTRQEYACTFCLDRTLKASPKQVARARAEYHRQINCVAASKAFSLLASFPADQREALELRHPVLRVFAYNHSRGLRLSPDLVTDATRYALIYDTDRELLACFAWLCSDAGKAAAGGSWQSFTGVGAAWPSPAERARIAKLALRAPGKDSLLSTTQAP